MRMFNRQKIICALLLSVVLGGRLLYVFSSKIDRPSEAKKSQDAAAKAVAENLSRILQYGERAMQQSYQRQQEQARRYMIEQERAKARAAQIERDELIREHVRESYRNSDPITRSMRYYYGQ